jgi:hypothetical protein
MKEIKKFLGSNENEDTSYQNLWDTAKAVLRGNFKPHHKTKAISYSLMIHLKHLEKQEQANPKSNRHGKTS